MPSRSTASSTTAFTRAPSCTPWRRSCPAVAALAERRGGVTGRDLIAAVAAGVDVAAALGLAAKGGMTFFRPATAGAFGAVAALGSVEGLAPDALVNVFGIVGGHACGTMQAHTEGSRLLPAQIAFNARGALTALDLAAAGLAGPREVLEGPFGYFRLFESGAWDLGPVLADLGRVWQITRVSHKPFPTGRATHAAIDGVLQLKRQHGFAAGEVASVCATVPPLIQRLVGRPDVPAPTASYARLCIPFVVATALLRGGVDVADFAPDRLADPAVHELAATGRRGDRRRTRTRTRSCRSGSKSCSARERAMSWRSRAPSGTRQAR